MSRTNGMAFAFFVAAFAAGAAAGVVVDRWTVRERAREQWGDERAMRTRFADGLGMNEAQRMSLDSVLDDRQRQRDSLMALVRPGLDSVSAAARQRIRQLLTPEQQASYDQMLREREDARRQERRQ